MAYNFTVDERYGGGYSDLGADYYDASNLTNTTFQLAARDVGYGNLTDAYFTPDEDMYSLGLLSTGYYSVDVDEYTWDYSSYSFGSIARFDVLNSNGVTVSSSSSIYSDISFAVNSVGSYYIRVVGSSAFSEQQYQLSYEKTGELNRDAIFHDSTAIVFGDIIAGGMVSADVSYFDPDGNSDGITLTEWYLDGVSQGYADTFVLQSSHVGKHLTFDINFFDDLGNFEFSNEYSAGTVLGPVPTPPTGPAPTEPTSPVPNQPTLEEPEIFSSKSIDIGSRLNLIDITLTGKSNIFGYGNENNNRIEGNSGSNKLKGDSGKDVLIGNGGNDKLIGGAQSDKLVGGAGNDVLKGQSDNDKLIGKADDDRLYGGGGNDVLRGNSGDDRLVGGEGKDTLIGGGGHDTFQFKKVTEMSNSKSGSDVIKDFKQGVDLINLRGIDASSVDSGNNSFIWQDNNRFRGDDSGELNYRLFDLLGENNDYTMIYLDTDGDKSSEAMIKIMGIHYLNESDFML